MSCLLLDGALPTTLGGVPILTNYRNMIRFELLLDDESVPDDLKVPLGLRLLFGDTIPSSGPQEAMHDLIWYYLRGKGSINEIAKDKDAGTGVRVCAHAVDADAIYASFLQAYHIDLLHTNMHWWVYAALLEQLPDTTPMGRIMQLRSMDLSSIKNKEQRAFYAKLKKQVALPRRSGKPRSAETLAERAIRRLAEEGGQAHGV